MKTIKNTIPVLLLLAVSLLATAQTAGNWKAIEKPLNFILANDLGRNGYYEQKTIAQTMGELAESIDVRGGGRRRTPFRGCTQHAGPALDD